MMLSLIMNLTYVALNFVLIHLADMGIMGMNISVNVSRYLAAACAIYYLVKMDESLRVRLRDMLQVNWSMLKKILSIGMPFAAEQMFFNGGKILTQIFIVSLGTYAIAANAISASLAMVIQIPANALSIAIVTVVGQCIGRREIEDARKLTRSFLWLSSATFVVMGLIILPLYHPLVSLFHRRRRLWMRSSRSC
ncbi:hypothetical protein HMSSN139_09900 [Paenibacillus sp. HMSSN-139]|nr:hypothetical protein HMSSN139_09900 [Paenibacillus sp. HMSSN-139]